MFIRSLFSVTCLSHLVVKIFGQSYFLAKIISIVEAKGNLVFSEDFASDVCLDLLGRFLITG